MKKIFFLLLIAFQLLSCSIHKSKNSNDVDYSGTYKKKSSSEKLVLKKDGTYVLLNPEITFTPAIEKCDFASTGRWSMLQNNLLEITSENYYTKQKGYEYNIEKKSSFSQDSLYIQIDFPSDFHPVKLNFYFNNNNSKSITTEKTLIVIPKSKYLWDRKINTNQISFSLDAKAAGVTLYNSRILFEIFNESIDTEKYNYLTIKLPNFDRCFFEFQPYKQELIYFDKKKLQWQGEIWEVEAK
ncbi:hypothetical protein [Flavobacterium sp. WV_118_3]|uniref:hypothetical protein n=1 Tax=Flavobacterium sp. WV_118_3 TaxID=3151764 RepID=UPI003219CCD9